MEHIIQFGVTVDDDAIKKRIEQQASDQVIKEIRKELGTDSSWYTDENVVRKLVNKEVTNLFDKHKDAIISEAGRQLADKLVKTKAVKEAVGNVLEEAGLK